MKITRLSLWHVPLTSHTAYYMSDGKTCDTVDTVVLRLSTDTGLHGWGEVCPIPHYLPAYARGVAPAVEEMAPELLGHDLDRRNLGRGHVQDVLLDALDEGRVPLQRGQAESVVGCGRSR